MKRLALFTLASLMLAGCGTPAVTGMSMAENADVQADLDGYSILCVSGPKNNPGKTPTPVKTPTPIKTPAPTPSPSAEPPLDIPPCGCEPPDWGLYGGEASNLVATPAPTQPPTSLTKQGNDKHWHWAKRRGWHRH
jgi:hypothetical protein